ncbi:hypothetical protein PybrP1_004408 [[Pythium] brassicae (nom. inval.)]|nr:hypothetical protein PybrP1_004408 [[Pythium] brassicae (nom. inval.)]
MDDDVYAYEQELNEMDDWEAMHAHEMEAAEEEMLAMESAYTEPPSTALADDDSAIDAKIARAQERLQKVLDRCATLMGEDDADAQDAERDAADVDINTRTHQLRSAAAPAAPSKSAAQAALDSTTASFLHSRPPVDVDSLPVVLNGGKRVFLRKKKKNAGAEAGALRSASSLSLVPIQELMASIERRQIEAAMTKTDAPLEDLSVLRPPQVQKTNVLWLDKYKPKRFIDLLSDERTNREVLLWVKKWDRFVFPDKKGPDLNHSSHGRAPGARDRPGGFGASSAGGGSSGSNTGFKQRFGVEGGEKTSSEDDDPRPFQKLILICGPPGAGKTTLANIVARHAGYNPIEVNASDDRTASVLKNKIISAMEMQSIFGARKPNCIILDEIDGAMNGGDGRTAIAAIQEIVSAPLPPRKSSSAGGGSGGKGKRAGGGASQHPLTRPMICICNDQYASVLRPLRKLAKIFVLDTPHAQRLMSRLKFICKAEGLKTSTGALSTLAASGGNDIRYCLNALQFHSTQPALASGLVGQKDHASGVYETMDKVFYQPKARPAQLSSSATSASSSAAGASPSTSSLSAFAEIEDAALSMGNTPLLLNALDENLPKMVFNDPTMSKLCDAFEWLGIADAWDTKVRAEQQFAFLAYVPFAALAVHRACCTSSRRRVEYPRAHFVTQQRAEKAVNILQAFVENSQLHPSLRVGPGVLAVDVVPWLVATLSPTIRRLNPSLQTAEEKAMVQRLIELMAALGLSFRPKHLPDGSEDYALEPALHELLEFRGGESDAAAHRAMLPLSVKKMITREVELQQMRRSEASSSHKKSDATPTRTPAPAGGEAAAFALPELSDEKMAAKLEAIRKRNPFAFAHREAKRKRDASEKQSAEELKGDGRGGGSGGGDARPVVRYKFNEGYTCGIITAVYMRDLL